MWGSTEKVSLKNAELSLNWQLRVSHLEMCRCIQGRTIGKVAEWTRAEIQENCSGSGEVHVLQHEEEHVSEEGGAVGLGSR